MTDERAELKVSTIWSVVRAASTSSVVWSSVGMGEKLGKDKRETGKLFDEK